PGDFVPLLPFEAGKEFVFQKPINYNVQGAITATTKQQLPTGPFTQTTKTSSSASVTGEVKISLKLKNKVPYQITETDTIDAFEYEAVYERSYTSKSEDKPEKGEPTSYASSYKESLRSTGIVANLGWITVLEQDSTRETDTDGDQRTDHTVCTGTKIRRAKAKIAPEEMSWDSLTQPFQEANAEFTSILEEAEAPAEPAAPIDPQQLAAKLLAQAQAQVPPKPAEVTEEEVEEEIIEPVDVEPEVEEVVEEQPSLEPEEAPPEPAPDEEFLPWVAEYQRTRTIMEPNMKTLDQFTNYIEQAKQFLLENPYYRKAFISLMMEKFGVSDPRLTAEMAAPPEDLIDLPIDYIRELLEPLEGTEPSETPKPAEIMDREAQRERDISRLKSAISETIDEIVEVFQENKEAWEELLEHLGISPADPVTDEILDVALKNPAKILGAFESLKLGTAMFKAFLKEEQMTRLRERLINLRKKLELVQQGILINPSI
ncbi:MAG: hypothetical protein ACFFDP_06595, partial [Promethearchaeota archaeon]